MAYWLLKSEPSSWSWQQQVNAGAKGTAWTGVRNHLAKQNLLAMRRGDLGFFYHSGDPGYAGGGFAEARGKEIVGIVEVIREAYPDPTAASGEPWVVVDVKAVKPLSKPVTLAGVKATPALSKMSLVTSARLSVQPVTEKEWEIVCGMV